MIDKLTKAQEAQLSVYRDRGIAAGLCCDPIDRAKAFDYAKRLQKYLKRPGGPVIIIPGPLHAWYSACLLGGAQVRAQVGAQVGDQVKDFVWPYLDGHWWASYWAWLSYHEEVVGVKITIEDRWILTEQRDFGLIYPLQNGATVICERPLCIKRRELRLHCENGPAVAYGDGTRVWALNGVCVPQALVETKAEALDCKDWITNANAEVRREFVRKVGAERIMVKLGSKRLDKQGDYELHEIDLQGRTGKWPALKMLNPSIGVWHVEWVDKACKTVSAALAWRNQSDAQPASLT
jgi:hypothetical protein